MLIISMLEEDKVENVSLRDNSRPSEDEPAARAPTYLSRARGLLLLLLLLPPVRRDT